MKYILPSLALVFFMLAGGKAMALESQCLVGVRPDSSDTYKTIYHKASWTESDYYNATVLYEVYPYVRRRATVLSPPVPTGTQIHSMAFLGVPGYWIQYYPNPADGHYTFTGDSHIGYDNGSFSESAWFEALWGTSCSQTNVGVNNYPATLNVSISANNTTSSSMTLMTGTKTRITWSSTNATNCTYNGGQAIPITSGTSANGYYEFYARPADAKTYTLTCQDAGGPNVSSAVTLTVDHPTGETTIYTGPISATGPTRTQAAFSNNLTPSNKVFTAMQVKEKTGGTVIDNCYKPGGTMQQITAIPVEDTWDVLSPNNKWGPDVIGFQTPGIDAYRAQGSVPCTITIPQDMEVVVPGGNVSYHSNFLKVDIRSDRIITTRNLVVGTIMY